MNKLFIGIDPGKTGSICLLDPSADDVKNVVSFLDINMQPLILLDELRQLNQRYDVVPIMVEKVRNIRGAASASNFNFGYNYGSIRTLAVCTGLGVDDAPVISWQSKLRVPNKLEKTARKKYIANRCLELYPFAELHGPKGGLLDGRSDALGIAHYSRLVYGQ